jgi:dTDP-4-amino-4,6-dideoxygalactose transaminase
MLGEAFNGIYRAENSLRCTDKDVNDPWLSYLDFGDADAWTDRRRAIAAAYAEGLRDSGLILPHVPDWADPAWHLYVIRSPDRDGLQKRLPEAGVGTLIHYPIPPHMQAAYADLGLAHDALPLARDLAGEVLSLPMGPQLAMADAVRVIDAVRAVV